MSTFAPQIASASHVPPFRQLHDAVIAAVQSGELLPGAKLPTVRALAETLGLATNTVASAYRSLESVGIVEGRGRAGTYVCLGDDPIEVAARTLTLEAVSSLRSLGVDQTRALRLFMEAWETRDA